jgi:hypothetical protein
VNKGACWTQNIFGTYMSCMPTALIFYFSNPVEYLLRIVLIFNFAYPTVSSENSASGQFPVVDFHELFFIVITVYVLKSDSIFFNI